MDENTQNGIFDRAVTLKLKRALAGVSGILTTPLDGDGALAPLKLKPIVERALEAGLHLPVVNGDPKQEGLLELEQAVLLVQEVVRMVGRRAPVLAGAGGVIERACALAKASADAGAEGLLVHLPQQSHASAGAMVDYLTKVTQASGDLPIVLALGGDALAASDIVSLCAQPGVIGVHWNGASPLKFLEARLACNPELIWACGGGERWASIFHAVGARGFTSHLVNAWPERIMEIHAGLNRSDLVAANGFIDTVTPFEEVRTSDCASDAAAVKALLCILDHDCGPAGMCWPLPPPMLAKLENFAAQNLLPSFGPENHPAPGSRKIGSRDVLPSRLDQTASKAIAQNRIVGCVLAVGCKGELLHHRAYGLADREQQVPMQADAIFRLSSLTKPIVALTVLAMAERGFWSLSDPITKYLPDFRPRMGDGSTPTITLDHLLSHTSGIGAAPPVDESDLEDPAFVAAGGELFHMSLPEAVQRLCRVPLRFAPGSGFAYAWGLDVLGAAIEVMTGVQLGESVDRFVCKPLGMTDTAFHATDPSRLVPQYADGPGGPRPMRDADFSPNRRGGTTVFAPARIFDPKVLHHGGGGTAGTARDFTVMLDCLSRGGAPLVSEELLAESLLDRVPSNANVSPWGWGFSRLGAVQRNPRGNGSALPPGGIMWGGIFGHSWFFDAGSGVTGVALTNTGVEGFIGAFPEQVRRAVFWAGEA